MARVTVEDCVDKIPNRYELVMVAAQRARDISAGAVLTVERDNDKNPVVALREIATETVSIPGLQEELVKNFQKLPEAVEPEEELTDLMVPDPKYAGDDLIGGGSMSDLAPVADDDDDDDEDLSEEGMGIFEDAAIAEEGAAAEPQPADDFGSGEDS